MVGIKNASALPRLGSNYMAGLSAKETEAPADSSRLQCTKRVVDANDVGMACRWISLSLYVLSSVDVGRERMP